MKKDLSIAMSFFSFFIQHLGKPQLLFYGMSFNDSVDFGNRPGDHHACIRVKQRMQ